MLQDQKTLDYVEKKLQEASYEPKLGIRLIRLSTMDVSGKDITLIAVRLDPGKQLIPHLHETDGEICFPLSEGVITLGNAVRDENNKYKVDGEKIVVEWGNQELLIPGKPIEIAPGIPHHLYAPKDTPVTVLFFLPATHLGEDRKFVTFPKIKG